ncbi:MAG: hypothetical protein Q9207_003081 [Kuettlingeria erythrocarpa]
MQDLQPQVGVDKRDCWYITDYASPELLALGYNLSFDDYRDVYKLRRVVQRDLACLTSIFRQLQSPFHASSQKPHWSAHPTAEIFYSITSNVARKVQPYLIEAVRVKVTADKQVDDIEVMWRNYSVRDVYPGLTEQSHFDNIVREILHPQPEPNDTRGKAETL